MTLICAKFDADLINISKVTSRKTKWPLFFGLPGTSVVTRRSFWRFPDWKFFFSRVYLIDNPHPLFRSPKSGKKCAAYSRDFTASNSSQHGNVQGAASVTALQWHYGRRSGADWFSPGHLHTTKPEPDVC